MKTLEQKRKEADARKAIYAAMSDEQKLELIRTRPGESRKERDRILKAVRKVEAERKAKVEAERLEANKKERKRREKIERDNARAAQRK